MDPIQVWSEFREKLQRDGYDTEMILDAKERVE